MGKPPVNGVSLDLSRKATGVTRWLDQHPVTQRVIELPEGELGTQLLAWRGHLERLLRPVPDWVAYEDTRAVNKTHGMIQFGMVGVLLMMATELAVPVMPVNPMTAKKVMTGNGRATKDQMLSRAQELYPELEVGSHDLADSLAVGLTFWHIVGPTQ